MPRSLSKVAPGETPIFVPRDFAKRPTLAALVAETISTWSYTEHAFGRSMAGMLRGSSTAAMQQYADTRRFSGTNSKSEILKTAAKKYLPKPYRDTFLGVMDIVSDYASKRHEFAHHIWGTIETLPEAILLVDPKHLFGHWGAANDWVAGFAANPGNVGTAPILSTDVVEVWTKADLETERDRMFKAYDLSISLDVISCLDTFGGSQFRRDHVHNQLLNDPVVIAAQLAASGPAVRENWQPPSDP